MTGNRCGHDPKHPNLSPAKPIRKGKGGLPRILSLAAERAKAWYYHPKKCPLMQANPKRRTRSERREACQIVLEAILGRLDLASMCLGTPTLASGFIDIDMQTIVRDSGIGQRRCERAIAVFKEAGFMKVMQPRTQNEEGLYFGCRAIRVVTDTFFEWLDLGPMLRRERTRASEMLRRKAQKANRKLSDFMRRMRKQFKSSIGSATRRVAAPCDPSREQRRLTWNRKWSEFVLQGGNPEDASDEPTRPWGTRRGIVQVRNIAGRTAESEPEQAPTGAFCVLDAQRQLCAAFGRKMQLNDSSSDTMQIFFSD